MCERFIIKFVDKVIKKLDEEIECDYYVMSIGKYNKIPITICSFKATKNSLPNILYDSLMSKPYHMAHIITNMLKIYPHLFDKSVSDWFIFWGDMTIDQYVHICEIFSQNNGKDIFNMIHKENCGFLDNLEYNDGKFCLLKDPTHIIDKLWSQK